jgi:ornithine cyclodeaminase/alanine dehydrogenase-like protein (mu-crystallin family)
VTVTDDITEGLKNADVVVTVTSAADAVILPHHLKKGAVVCDVARPAMSPCGSPKSETMS